MLRKFFPGGKGTGHTDEINCSLSFAVAKAAFVREPVSSRRGLWLENETTDSFNTKNIHEKIAPF